MECTSRKSQLFWGRPADICAGGELVLMGDGGG